MSIQAPGGSIAHMADDHLVVFDLDRRVIRTVPAAGVHGGIEAVFDARGRRIGTVDVGGEAGNVQYDAGSGHMLVAVQTRDDVAVIDPRTNRVARRVACPAATTRTGSSSTRRAGSRSSRATATRGSSRSTSVG